MISVRQAKALVKKVVSSLEVITVEVIDAQYHYLAEDVVSPVAIPLFSQSAMDGYAFRFEDVNEALTIVDEIAAGDIREIVALKKNEAVRIFTGSKVPKHCDTVVMQELTELKEGKLFIKDKRLKKGGNIRVKGNQIKTGSVALKKGTAINAGSVGFLATLGVLTVKVYQHPKIAIIATGSELVAPGNQLQEGQVYESNTIMLKAALHKKGIKPTIYKVEDNKKATQQTIAKALEKNNLLIISGGISVGKYDFVKVAIENNGVEEIFYKVKQKPGKPLYFGTTGVNTVFALPGNPAAALTCFYEYVALAIHCMIGNPQVDLTTIKLPIGKSYNKKTGRANFLKATTDFKTVVPFDGQGSDALQAFSLSNCLIYLPEEVTVIHQHEMVEVHLLPC